MPNNEDTDNLPRWTTPDDPEIGVALNMLAEAIEKLAARKIEFGQGFEVNSDGNTTAVSAPPNDSEDVVQDEHSLQLFDASENDVPKLRIVTGICARGNVPASTINVSDKDKIWIQWACSYDTGSGDWNPNDTVRSLENGSEFPADSNSLAVLKLASVRVNANGKSVVQIKLADDDEDADGTGDTQDRYGPVHWQRPNGPTDYENDFISPGP